MKRYVDFSKLKSRVGIEAVVGLFNLTLRKQGDALVGDCPLCGSGRTDATKFRVSPDKGDSGAWNCFGCDEGGNMFDLVAAINDVSLQKAAVYIAEQFDITDCDFKQSSRRKRNTKTNSGKAKTNGNAASGEEAYEVNADTPQVERQAATEADYAGDSDELCVEDEADEIRFNPPLDWEGLKNLDTGHEAVLDAGLDPDICAYFQAGYCSRGMMQGRLAVPIHNLGGVLLGYCGIALGDCKNRFKFPPADKYERGIDLFNLHRAVESSVYKKGTGLLIVEDILDVFSVYASGTESVIATMGGAPTYQHLLRLREVAIAGGQISVLWEKPSEELDKAVAKIAEFSWVRLRYKS